MERHLGFTSWPWFRKQEMRVIAHLLAVVFIFTCFTVQPAVAQQTPTPEAQGYRGLGQESLYTGDFADLALTIDTFWSTTFEEFGVPYVSPGIVPLDLVRETACGRHGPSSNALYCTLDLTIYLSPTFLAEQDAAVGDYAPMSLLMSGDITPRTCYKLTTLVATPTSFKLTAWQEFIPAMQRV
jgi:predicted metalloprotease